MFGRIHLSNHAKDKIQILASTGLPALQLSESEVLDRCKQAQSDINGRNSDNAEITIVIRTFPRRITVGYDSGDCIAAHINARTGRIKTITLRRNEQVARKMAGW